MHSLCPQEHAHVEVALECAEAFIRRKTGPRRIHARSQQRACAIDDLQYSAAEIAHALIHLVRPLSPSLAATRYGRRRRAIFCMTGTGSTNSAGGPPVLAAAAGTNAHSALAALCAAFPAIVAPILIAEFYADGKVRRAW